MPAIREWRYFARFALMPKEAIITAMPSSDSLAMPAPPFLETADTKCRLGG